MRYLALVSSVGKIECKIVFSLIEFISNNFYLFSFISGILKLLNYMSNNKITVDSTA